MPKTLKMISAASLGLTLSINSCAEDKETASGIYVRKKVSLLI